MDSQTVLFSLLAGLLIYVILELDKRYLSLNDESKKYTSLRISALLALVVYAVVSYFKCSITCDSKILNMKPSTSSPYPNQTILNEPF